MLEEHQADCLLGVGRGYLLLRYLQWMHCPEEIQFEKNFSSEQHFITSNNTMTVSTEDLHKGHTVTLNLFSVSGNK